MKQIEIQFYPLMELEFTGSDVLALRRLVLAHPLEYHEHYTTGFIGTLIKQLGTDPVAPDKTLIAEKTTKILLSLKDLYAIFKFTAIQSDPVVIRLHKEATECIQEMTSNLKRVA